MSARTTVAAPLDPEAPLSEVSADSTGPTGRQRRDRRVPMSKIVAPLVLLAIFIAIWYMMHYWGLRFFFDKDGRRLVPTPLQVWNETIMQPITRRRYIEGVKWTSIVAFGGLAITIVIGCSLAVLMSQATWVERATYPYLVALQAVPILAVIPLIYSVFGGGLTPRFFVCIMIAFFPIVTNTLFGLNSADPDQHDLFTLRNASRWTRLTKLQLPGGTALHLHRLSHLGRSRRDRRRRRRAVLPRRQQARRRHRDGQLSGQGHLRPRCTAASSSPACSASSRSCSSAGSASSSSATGTRPASARREHRPIHRTAACSRPYLVSNKYLVNTA